MNEAGLDLLSIMQAVSRWGWGWDLDPSIFKCAEPTGSPKPPGMDEPFGVRHVLHLLSGRLPMASLSPRPGQG